MRKLLTLAFAHVLALAFLMVGSAPAHAFGSEVLGCAVSANAWTANSCAGDGDTPPPVIHLSAHNLSGSYSMRWSITGPTGYPITSNCSSTTTINCISSGCTVSSATCDLRAQSGKANHTYTASLRLTQSGLSRTIQAQAVVYGVPCSPIEC